MKNIIYLPIVISLFVTGANASQHFDHDERINTDRKYKQMAGHCPCSALLREALVAHKEDVMHDKDFRVKVGDATWQASNVKIWAPKGTSFEEMIKQPVVYNSGGPGSNCIAQFTPDDHLNWLVIIFGRVRVTETYIPCNPYPK